MAVAALLLVAVGVALIAIGTYISLHEWRREQRRQAQAMARSGEVKEEAAGVGEAFEGLAALAEALRDHKLGMQLIIVGIALITLGGIMGGVGGFTNCP